MQSELNQAVSYNVNCDCGLETTLFSNNWIKENAKSAMIHTCECGISVEINILTSFTVLVTGKPKPKEIQDGFYNVALAISGMEWNCKIHRKNGLWEHHEITEPIPDEFVTIVSPITQSMAQQST